MQIEHSNPRVDVSVGPDPYRIAIELPSGRVASILESAVERSSTGYWAHVTRSNQGGYLVTEMDDGRRLKSTSITPRKIKAGIALMAATHPWDFAKILTGKDDADTADVFLQLVCFGEVRYG